MKRIYLLITIFILLILFSFNNVVLADLISPTLYKYYISSEEANTYLLISNNDGSYQVSLIGKVKYGYNEGFIEGKIEVNGENYYRILADDVFAVKEKDVTLINDSANSTKDDSSNVDTEIESKTIFASPLILVFISMIMVIMFLVINKYKNNKEILKNNKK